MKQSRLDGKNVKSKYFIDFLVIVLMLIAAYFIGLYFDGYQFSTGWSYQYEQVEFRKVFELSPVAFSLLVSFVYFMIRRWREFDLAKQELIIRNKEIEKVVYKFNQAEKASNESTKKLETALNAANLGSYDWNDEEGEVTFNRIAIEILGHELNSNTDWSLIIHPDDLQNVIDAKNKIGNNNKFYDIEYRIITISGDIKWLSDRGKVVKWREDGKALRISGIIQDITKRRKIEEALHESENRSKIFSDAIGGAFDAIVICDLEDKITYANSSTEKLYGYGNGELIGKSVKSLNPDPEKVLEMMSIIIDTGGWSGETLQQKKDGGTFSSLISISQIQDKEGKIIGTMGAIRDITFLKEAEERVRQAQKLEIVGTLAAGVAHDLNNILSGIVGYPQLLLMKLPEDSPLRNSVEAIQKSGKKAATIVRDLLTLARRGLAISEVVNMNQIISEYLESPEYKKMLSYHPGVELEYNIDDELLNVQGSSVHLSDTIMNLISNAAEAMPYGGKITLSTENRYIDTSFGEYDEVEAGDYVIVTVSDNGEGITARDIKHIFEPFYTKKKLGRSGTGLGMTVVWGTISDHKGYIDVQSVDGEGTTFTLYFPATVKKKEKNRNLISISDHMGNKETVLVVDDVEEQREIAAEMLKTLGYLVETVSSGEEAIEYLKSNRTDLLVLDMIMDPGIDGLDTYKQALDLHPDLKVIIATGFSETDRLTKAKEMGIRQVLKKPYGLNEIAKAVKTEIAA